MTPKNFISDWAFDAPNLTEAEEKYALDIADHDTIVESHMKLCVREANKASHNAPSSHRDDLLSEAIMGLYDCLETAGYRDGFRFSAIAVIYIKFRIVKYLKAIGAPVYDPSRPTKSMILVKKLVEERGTRADVQHISDLTGVPVDEVAAALDTITHPNISYCIEEMVSEGDSPEDDAANKSEVASLRIKMDRLREENGMWADVLEARYLQGMKVNKIAKSMGISQTRVYAICEDALERVKSYYGETE